MTSYWTPKHEKWEQFTFKRKLFLNTVASISACTSAVLTSHTFTKDRHAVISSLVVGLIGILAAYVGFLTVHCKLTFNQRPDSITTFAQIFLAPVCTVALTVSAMCGASAGLLAGMVALLVAALGFKEGWKGVDRNYPLTPYAKLTILFFLPFYLIAVVFRSTLIRTAATFMYFRNGLRAFPQNWNNIMVRMDLAQPAEVVPSAGIVSPYLSAAGLRHMSRTRTSNLSKVAFAVFGLVYFATATFYRWSLKSTLWAWWPLVFFSDRIFYRMSADQRENRTRLNLSWAKIPLVLNAFYVIAFLVYLLNFPGLRLVIDAINGTFFKLASAVQQLTSLPPLGLIWWGFLFAVIISLGLCLSAHRMKTLFSDDLIARRVPLLSDDNRREFAVLARRLEIWRKAFWFSLAQTCWFTTLYLVQLKDPGFARLPPWVL